MRKYQICLMTVYDYRLFSLTLPSTPVISPPQIWSLLRTPPWLKTFARDWPTFFCWFLSHEEITSGLKAGAQTCSSRKNIQDQTESMINIQKYILCSRNSAEDKNQLLQPFSQECFSALMQDLKTFSRINTSSTNLDHANILSLNEGIVQHWKVRLK